MHIGRVSPAVSSGALAVPATVTRGAVTCRRGDLCDLTQRWSLWESGWVAPRAELITFPATRRRARRIDL